MDTDDDTRRALGGLSLEQFAGVTAATAEGVPLDRVLTQERLAEEVWRRAAPLWREAIADSPELQVELVRLRRIAEDCLRRDVSPLDSDPAAWVGLLGALGKSTRPASVLAALGVTASDVSRLGRHWKQRAKEDPELAKRLTEIGGTAMAPEAVEVGPLELRPFPWSPRPKAPRLDAPSPTLSAPGERAGLPAPPVIRQRASFQLGAAPIAVAIEPAAAAAGPALPPGPAAPPEETLEIDGREIADALARPLLPFVPGPPARSPSWTETDDTMTAIEHGETLLADGAAIRETLTSGAIPFANREDLARASIRGRVERFAAIQAAAQRSENLEVTLRTYGFSTDAWEVERRALAAELASTPTLRALYERAWREATRR